jgi:hypothetical protein
MLYTVVYGFVDAHQCPVGTLTIEIGTGEAPPPTQTPESQRACMTIHAAYEQPGFLFIRGTTVNISVPITINYEDTRETTFQICGTPRQQVLFIAPETYWTEEQQEVPFARWERMNTATGEWEPVSESPALATTMVDGASFRALYTGEPLVTVTPTPPQQASEVCLGVDAVFIYQRIGTTTAYQQPQTEEPIAVQITVNQSQYQTTKFALCATPGTQYFLQAPEEHYTAQEQRLVFSHWERYDPIEQTWIPFAEALLLRVTLQSGGQLRAVYRSGASMY